MNKLFYARLAAQNIRKNCQFYLPYLLAGAGTAAMFYIMAFIANNQGLMEMRGGSILTSFLGMGQIIVGLFAVIFLFYTNSFLMKRRRRELGLYNILGMEKRHLAKMLFWETLYAFLISVLGGLLLGVVFSKLVFMILLKLATFPVAIRFEVSLPAALLTLMLFSCVFFLILLNSLRSLHMAKPVELLQSSHTGEREPRAKLLLALLGLICMAAGYYLSITTKEPAMAVGLFFIAVILVIIGTYCLFTAGSITLLKLLRKNKKYYYQTRHFTLVSGMLYRMKQNAVGLGNICILSTMVLVTLCTTITLYVGTEDSLNQQYPFDVIINKYEGGDQRLDENVLLEAMCRAAEDAGCEVTGQQAVRFFERGWELELSGGERPTYFLYCLDQAQHELLTGETLDLQAGEAALFFTAGGFPDDTFSISGKTYRVAKRLSDAPHISDLRLVLGSSCYLVLPEEADVLAITADMPEYSGGQNAWMTLQFGLDLKGSDRQVEAATEALRELAPSTVKEYDDAGNVVDSYTRYRFFSRQEEADYLYSFNGGFLFLGVFFGVLFAMAAVLIMYYKQISEGYEDKQRFEIMRKVGMSGKEIRAAINSQILLVFFLPLVVAGMHLAGAFPIIARILWMFQLFNIRLFVLCTVGTLLVFALLYGVVYRITSRVYYRIVK